VTSLFTWGDKDSHKTNLLVSLRQWRSLAAYKRLTAEGPPLPSGWEKKRSPDGKVFYVDHNSGSTSWDRPAVEEAALYLRSSSGESMSLESLRESIEQAEPAPPLALPHSLCGPVVYEGDEGRQPR
jgi:hypothetical protein